MQIAVLAVLLAAVLSLLCLSIQEHLRNMLKWRPGAVWSVPVILTAAFSGAALLVNSWTLVLCLAVLGYAAAPVLCAWLARGRTDLRPSGLDFATILLIWLPMEFGAGASLVPEAARAFLHSVAYGIAILLGLTLFACFRGFAGLKYNFPRQIRDGWLPLALYAISAPVLIAIGMAIGFIPAPHLPVQRGGAMAAAVPVIFFGTALPEEILFRSLIQNLLMQRFGSNWRTLLVASMIFGSAHLDNGPQVLPNWRYAIVATVAGVAYGAVFQRASSVLSSATLHMMVDWTKHYFF